MNGRPSTWFMCEGCEIIYDWESMWDYLWTHYENHLRATFYTEGMTNEQFDAEVEEYCKDLMEEWYGEDEYRLLEIEPVPKGYPDMMEE